MVNELKKSLSSILYERTTSPFYGTLIVSWLIWNWRIIYLTFIISENAIGIDKITYITDNYSDIHHLVTFPILSTVLLLTIVPFISNGAFWLNLNFENWKRNQKNQIEKKQLLTLEQSIELREQLVSQENRFEKLLEDKNLEIKQLTKIIEDINKNTAHEKTDAPPKQRPTIDFTSIIDKIEGTNKYSKEFDKIVEFIQIGYGITDRSDISTKLITLLEVNDFISPKGEGKYSWTENGKVLIKKLMK